MDLMERLAEIVDVFEPPPIPGRVYVDTEHRRYIFLVQEAEAEEFEAQLLASGSSDSVELIGRYPKYQLLRTKGEE